MGYLTDKSRYTLAQLVIIPSVDKNGKSEFDFNYFGILELGNSAIENSSLLFKLVPKFILDDSLASKKDELKKMQDKYLQNKSELEILNKHLNSIKNLQRFSNIIKIVEYIRENLLNKY